MASHENQDVAALLKSLTAYLPSNHASFQATTPIASVQQEESQPRGIANSSSFNLQPSSVAHPNLTQDSDVSQYASGQYFTTVNAHEAYSQPQPPPKKAGTRLATPVQTNTVDPRSIIEWSPALRYMTRLTGQHQDVVERLRKTIANQHDNERQWWEGREALLKRQAARVDGKQELDSVLRAVGVQVTNELPGIDDDAELKRYDIKVHNAQAKMVDAIEGELKALGVPFFGTREDLIVKADENGVSGRDVKQITRNELRALQRKMLSFIEDLCRD